MRSNEPWTRHEALVRLQAAYGELGRPPTRAEWIRWRCTPSAATIAKLFGSWQDAWIEASKGLTTPTDSSHAHRGTPYPV